MLVAIHVGPQDGKKALSFYDCDRFYITPEGEEESEVRVDLESDKGRGTSVTRKLVKANSNIFLMNNEGKTFETFRWN